ncbi:MAG: hypothetical protein KKF41_03780 [Actinobacteria bacterium]|nr:hypothetical protein [Actinomycetota bacterium]MBU1942131.1 hypothetical protein [Actinomycetota bacterium]MBU2686685.1 hypothetical protein [Actinomycetota bacterium]
MAEDEFFSRYHKAMVEALGGHAERIKPRIASAWVKEWQEKLDGSIENPDEFARAFEGFLSGELGFADTTRVRLDDDLLLIDVGGCSICFGNELLRKEGKQALCPILPTGLTAINRVLGKKATLLGVDKDGTVGDCTIRYRLSEK